MVEDVNSEEMFLVVLFCWICCWSCVAVSVMWSEGLTSAIISVSGAIATTTMSIHTSLHDLRTIRPVNSRSVYPSVLLCFIMGPSFLEGGPIMYRCCPSVCPVPPPRGKTKRPTNTKLVRKGLRDTSTLWTNFKVKGSKVKVTGHSSCVNVSLIIRIDRYWLVD